VAWATVPCAAPRWAGDLVRWAVWGWVAREKMASQHAGDGDPERELLKRDRQAMRPSLGFRLASVAGVVAIMAALLVFLREYLAGAISPVTTINILGLAALSMGMLRLVGAFEIERRTGHRWSFGGLILGVLEVGTGMLLVATDTVSRGVMITIGVWALASGTLLIVEAIRARRRVTALLGTTVDGGPRSKDGQR
jgi:uncharacterized membrane protein HdeD (DUF308 family)